MKQKLEKIGKQRLLGVVLIAVGLLTAYNGCFGILSWQLSYWDHELYETYRDYDIYYFTTLDLYTIDTGDDLTTGTFHNTIETARGTIDNWLDEAIYVEEYLGYDIYRESGGAQRYFAVHIETETVTAYWDSRIELKGYLKDLYEMSQEPLDGSWYINGVKVTSEDQIIVINTVTLDFKFETEASVTQVNAAWFGPEDGTIELTRSGMDWTGSKTLQEGTYTMVLSAIGPDGSLHLSLVGEVAEETNAYVRWAVGGIITAVGAVVFVNPKNLKKKK